MLTYKVLHVILVHAMRFRDMASRGMQFDEHRHNPCNGTREVPVSQHETCFSWPQLLPRGCRSEWAEQLPRPNPTHS